MYIYTWGNNEKRKQYSGKQCEIVKTLATMGWWWLVTL